MDRNQELYDRNRAFFERDYPAIYQKLRDIGPARSTLVGSVETGGVNLDLGHTLFYDTDAASFAARQIEDFNRVPGQFFMDPPQRYDPPEFVHERVCEAMYEYLDGRPLSKLPVGDAHDAGYLLVFGLGLGFHIEPLLERCDVRYVIIMEEFLEFLDHSFWLQDWEALHAKASARNTRFFFIFGSEPDQIHSRMHWFMRGEGFGLIDGSYIFRHYRSMVLDAVYAQFRKELPLLPVSIGFWEDEILMLDNCAHNLINRDSYLLDSTPRLERDVPAFIVGSGPSIDHTIAVIKANRDKAIVFSCGSGLSALLRNGVTPDFHCELENVPGSYIYLQKERAEHGSFGEITLIAANTVGPFMLDMFDKPILFFRDSVSSTVLWAPDKLGIYGASPTVTNVGIRASLLMGFREIYLFGVDLGSRDPGRRHSKQSLYETNKEWADVYEDRDRKWNISLPANFGGTAYTNDILQWARMLMIHSLDPFPSAKVYNCSDGVKITGTIPKLAKTVRLNTPTGRAKQIARQIKESLSFHEAPGLIAAVRIEDVIAEFEDWAATVDTITAHASASGQSFNAFYEAMIPLLRTTGDRTYQNVIRAVYIGSLMMNFQIGYFFWHRTQEADQPAMMAAFLAAFDTSLRQMHRVTLERLRNVAARLGRRKLGAISYAGFDNKKIKAPLAAPGPAADAALDRAVDHVSRTFAAKRDLKLACSFLSENWHAPRFWLFGAGTHSAELIKHFGETWHGRLIGVGDRNPAGRTEIAGTPIVPASELAHDTESPILVAHPFMKRRCMQTWFRRGLTHHDFTDFISIPTISTCPVGHSRIMADRCKR